MSPNGCVQRRHADLLARGQAGLERAQLVIARGRALDRDPIAETHCYTAAGSLLDHRIANRDFACCRRDAVRNQRNEDANLFRAFRDG
jgi:hypothetical protein